MACLRLVYIRILGRTICGILVGDPNVSFAFPFSSFPPCYFFPLKNVFGTIYKGGLDFYYNFILLTLAKEGCAYFYNKF
jgi:hypothetical protein